MGRFLASLVLAVFAVTSSVLAGPLAAAAHADYPSPAPDFAHPDTPHDYRYSTTSGRDSRPLLVIYRAFSDGGIPAGQGPGWVENLVFGPDYPSVVDWYDEVSFGKFGFFPAAETQGDTDDGMVYVIAGTKSEYEAMTQAERGRTALQAADPYVDFSQFDEDGNGRLTADELSVVQTFVEPYPEFDGGARGIDPVVLDGVQLNTLGYMAYMRSTWGLKTYAHELMHVAFYADDTYGFGVGSLDTMGGDAAPSTWHKFHLGWSTPVVITRDGYYTVWDAYSTDFAYVLYDYDRGTDDYFIVENRQRTVGGYDDNISDSGLVIWRVDEAVYGSEAPDVRPIELMAPDGVPRPSCWKQMVDGKEHTFCYGGDVIDAWDPSDPSTPQRTFQQPWRDGTPSGVAVRAISASDYAMRVYFDVRGPGIMVDTSDATGRTTELVTPPGSTIKVPFTAMNTGEAGGTFLLEMSTLPPGWTAGFRYDVLDAGEQIPATLTVQIPPSTAEGTYLLRVRGQSAGDSSVDSVSDVLVKVVDHATDVEVFALDSVSYGTQVALRAKVTDPESGEDGGLANLPIEDVPVTFTIGGPGGTQTESATTDHTGNARITPTLDLPPGDYVITASTPRVGIHAPATATAPITLTKHEVDIILESGSQAYVNGDVHLRAVLFDESAPPLPSGASRRVEPGVPVTFTVDGGDRALTAFGETDSSGRVDVDLYVDLPAGTYPLLIEAQPTDHYEAASLTRSIRVEKHYASTTYTGASQGAWGDPADFKAEAFDRSAWGASVEGVVVEFTLSDSSGVVLTAAGVCDASGAATAAPILDLAPGDYTLTASVREDDVYRPITTPAISTFSVVKREVTVIYTGDLAADYSDLAHLQAEARDAIDGSAIEGLGIEFALGGADAAAVTDEAGQAAVSLSVRHAAGEYLVTAAFAGDDWYAPATSPAQAFQVSKESLSLAYVGDTQAVVNTPLTIAVRADEEPDSGLGDLTLAEVHVELTSLLGLPPRTYDIALDATGAGSLVLPDGLPSDVYSIRLTVAGGNGYWHADPIDIGEGIVVADLQRSLVSGFVGTDGSGETARLAGVAAFKGSALFSELRGALAGGKLTTQAPIWFVATAERAAHKFEAQLGGRPVTGLLSTVTDPFSGQQQIRIVLEDAGGIVYDSGAIAVKSGILAIR